MLRATTRMSMLALAPFLLISPAKATQIQVYGAWHCGNDYCTWASVRDMADFDTKNHWLVVAEMVARVSKLVDVRQGRARFHDIEKRIEPGVVGELTFRAYATGRFPLHSHASAERPGSHTHEEPPLAYIEVYPR